MQATFDRKRVGNLGAGTHRFGCGLGFSHFGTGPQREKPKDYMAFFIIGFLDIIFLPIIFLCIIFLPCIILWPIIL